MLVVLLDTTSSICILLNQLGEECLGRVSQEYQEVSVLIGANFSVLQL
jgi:hypothetical protein